MCFTSSCKLGRPTLTLAACVRDALLPRPIVLSADAAMLAVADVMQEFSMRPPQVPAAPAGYPQFHSPGHLPPGAYASHPQRGPAHAPGYGPPPRGPYPSASGAPPYPPASGASAFPPSAGAPPYPATSGTPSYPPSSASYPSPTYPRPPGHGPAPSHPSPAAASPASAYAHGAGTAASGVRPRMHCFAPHACSRASHTHAWVHTACGSWLVAPVFPRRVVPTTSTAAIRAGRGQPGGDGHAARS